MYSATYPDKESLIKNNIDVKFHHDKGHYVANWEVLAAYTARVQDPKFVRALLSAVQTDFPVLHMVGESDGQVPERAQRLWASALLGSRAEPMPYRRQLVIKDTGHFIFDRQSDKEPSWKEPDVIALSNAVEFIHDTYHATIGRNKPD